MLSVNRVIIKEKAKLELENNERKEIEIFNIVEKKNSRMVGYNVILGLRGPKSNKYH